MKNCIFCKIIKGEIPSSTVYEDEKFKVIMDISPAEKGHAILIAKNHFTNLYEIDDETAKEIMLVVRKVGIAMKKALKCDGLNILQNNGEVAGQTVFHYHIHMIPRYVNDNISIRWTNGTYADGEAAKLAELINSELV